MPLLPPVTMATLFFNDMMRPLVSSVCVASGMRRPGGARVRPLLLARAASRRCCFGSELIDQVRHECRPARLVRSAAPAAILAMEILVEKDVILEIGIRLKLFVVPENGTSAVGTANEQPEKTPA